MYDFQTIHGGLRVLWQVTEITAAELQAPGGTTERFAGRAVTSGRLWLSG